MALAALLGLLAACRGGNGAPDIRDAAAFLFDETAIRTYELAVAEQDWQWLNTAPNELLEQYVPATLSFEGEEYPEAAVRYKGFYDGLVSCFVDGKRVCRKLSLRLSFNEYDEGGRFHGLKRLNFHSMESDPTAMHDMLAYHLFREAGVPAPRAAYARLAVNGEPLGLFTMVEQIDGQFTRSRFPDGGAGNLYEEAWPVHSEAEPYLSALRTNREEAASVDKMVRFARALDEATDDALPSVLASWMDADMLASYFAVDRLIDNWDGVTRWICVVDHCFNHNYYWYEDAERDRMWLIPWDLNHTFEVPSPYRGSGAIPDWDVSPTSCEAVHVSMVIPGRPPERQLPSNPIIRDRPPACDELTRRLYLAIGDRYAERTRDLLDGPFRTSTLHRRIDSLAERIAGAVAEDPHGPTPDEWRAAVDKLKLDVVTMRSYIEPKVGR